MLLRYELKGVTLRTSNDKVDITKIILKILLEYNKKTDTKIR